MFSALTFATYGCDNTAAVGAIDFEALYYVLGIMWIFYGIMFALSPFKLFPTTGTAKYAWLGLEAMVRVDSENRGNYDHWVTGQTHMIGVYMIGSGCVLLWATGDADRGSDFTFFHALLIWAVLSFVGFCKVIYFDLAKFNALVWAWGAMFLIQLILIIVVLSDNDTDLKQFSDAASSGDVDVGAVLWFIFAFNFGGALNIYASSFGPMEAFGPTFYTKEPYVQTAWSKFIQRTCAHAALTFSMFLLWAAMNWDEAEDFGKDFGKDFSFITAVWVGQLLFLVVGITEFVGNEQMFEDFAILQFGLFNGCILGAAITMSAIADCN